MTAKPIGPQLIAWAQRNDGATRVCSSRSFVAIQEYYGRENVGAGI